MTPQQRTPLYNTDPIRAGSHFLQVKIQEQTVPAPYEAIGQRRYVTLVKYAVIATVGVVESTKPWSTPRDKHKAKNEGTFSTVEEAEARAREVETEYSNRGWHYYDEHFLDVE